MNRQDVAREDGVRDHRQPSSYFDKRAVHDKYAQSEGRSFQTKRKKDFQSSESAGIPE